MNKLIENIQNDILEPSAELTTILLKAKVLAHQLKNERFQNWVRFELDGYRNMDDVPDYRVFGTQLLAHFSSRYMTATDIPIGLSSTPQEFQKVARTVRYTSGIRAAEELARRQNTIDFPWSAEWIAVWTRANASQLGFQQLISVSRPVSPQLFAQMVQSVRSRLQDFILDLEDTWTIENKIPPPESIEKMVTINILNQNLEGTMSTFDQRNQKIQSQNNAAGNVNIAGNITINNNAELAQALGSLRDSLKQIEPTQQEEARLAIAVLEATTRGESTPKSQIVQAVETLSTFDSMKKGLEDIALGTVSGFASTAIVEAIKFVLG